MLLLHPKAPRRGIRDALREAVRDARETYRLHSGAVPADTPQQPTLPAHPDDHDVVVDIPEVRVDEIDLKLEELTARVALQARVLDLLRLDVGVDAHLQGVDLQIKGVAARATLKARLDNLTQILDRVMTTIDRNPQLLTGLTEGLGTALGELGSGTGRAVGDLGHAAATALDEVGDIATGGSGRP